MRIQRERVILRDFHSGLAGFARLAGQEFEATEATSPWDAIQH